MVIWEVPVLPAQGQPPAGAVGGRPVRLCPVRLSWLGLLLLLASTAASAAPVEWIWYPEGNPAREAPAGECFLRATFDLPAAPTEATLAITADDAYEVFVNGKRAGADDREESWRSVESLAVVPLLVGGRNVVAARCRNGQGPAGLIARLTWKAGGKEGVFVTGQGWLAAREAPAGWEQPAFDASRWKPAFRAAAADWPLPLVERAKVDPSVADEVRAHRERTVAPARARWPKRPAPAKLLCSTIWLGGSGALTFDEYTAYVDNMARAGFHVLSLGVSWDQAEPRPGEWNLAFTDNAITYAANQGLWVQVRLVTRPLPKWIEGDLTQVDHHGKGSAVPVFTDAGLNARQAGFYRAIAARYRGYPILSYSSAFSEAAETEYHMGGLWRDYSAPAVAHFREFLKRRYPSLAALNRAWGTEYVAWEEVKPEFHGDGLPARPARYSDWMRQREEALLELNTLLAKALKEGDPQAEYAVQCGRIYSGECAVRGTVGVGAWARHADWVITDPAPRDDVRWQSAVCRAFGKGSVAELDGLYAYDRDKVDPMVGIPTQVRDGFAAGIRMMQLCHWYPKDVRRYPDLFALLGKIAREANNAHPATTEAIWAGKWDLYRAAAAGGDPAGACARLYADRVAAGADPDILTDDVVRAQPGVLQRYRRIHAPALAWIERELLDLLRATGALQLPADRVRFQAPDGSEWEEWSGADALLAHARAARPKERGARILAAAEDARKAKDAGAAAAVLPLLQAWLARPEAFAGRLFLVAECAVDDSALGPGKSNGVRFQVLLRSGGKESLLVDQMADGPGWRQQVVEVPAAGPVEVELVADPNGNFAWDRGLWGDVRLVYAPDAESASKAPAFTSFQERAGDARAFVRTPAGDEAIGRGASFARGTGTAGGEARPAIQAVPPWQGAMGQTRAVYRLWLP